MESLWQDLRYSFRKLIKNPAVSCVVIFSLALGIGGDVTVFSLINAILLRPLPGIKEPERLVWAFSSISILRNNIPMSYPDYLDIRKQNQVFSGLMAFTDQKLNLRTNSEPVMLYGELVSSNYFSVLGVDSMYGRTFAPDDAQEARPDPLAVLSYGMWERNFSSDPGVVGRTIVLNGASFTVIGVTPKQFIGTEAGLTPDVWIPISTYSLVNPKAPEDVENVLSQRNLRRFNVWGRLKPDVSSAQASASLAVLARNLEQQYPDTNRQITAQLLEVSGGMGPKDRQDMEPAAALMIGLFTLVLLIACVNVVSLLLTRAALRQKEIAVRLALGANRRRLIQQLLIESLVLFTLGGLLGMLFAYWSAGLLITLAPSDRTIALDSIMDGRVFGFTLLLSALTGTIFGLAPALQASKPNLLPALKNEVFLPSGDPRKFQLRNLFLIVQLALSVVLLVCAGLFIRSLLNVRLVQPGFEVQNGVVIPLELGLLKYTKENGQEFYRRAISRVEAVPGVRSASLLRFVPLGASASGRSVIQLEGAPVPPDGFRLMVGTNIVGTRFFQTMGIPLIRGRDFTEQDREGESGKVIINEAAASRFWPDQDPLGKRISLGEAQGQFHEIIGVVKDSKYETLWEEPQPFIYQPFQQNYSSDMRLLVRSDRNPTLLVGAVRNQLLELDKNLTLRDIRSLPDLLSASMAPVRAVAWLLGGFGVLALTLAAVGLYGALAYSVSQRTREIGIRISLGAQPRDVLLMIMKEGMLLVLKGVVLGVILALIAGRALSSFVYGISVTDPVIFLVVLLLLGVIALIASFIPARRGTKVDPMVALRFD